MVMPSPGVMMPTIRSPGTAPPFGNDTGGMGAQLAGNADHLLRRRHFKIKRLADALIEPRNVVIDDVAAILAQMRGDAIGASRDGDLRSLDGIGMPSTACVANGGDVIDIDAEADGSGCRHILCLVDCVVDIWRRA